MANIEITNEDNMQLMARYPDKYFDLAIVDPPYGINVNMNMGVRKGEKTKHKSKKWDNQSPNQEYFNELYRITKNQIIWGANNYSNLLKPSSEWVYWDKLITGKVDFSAGELAYTSFKGSLKSFKFAIQSNYILEKRIHPTQKPVSLYKWLLDKYANKGDKILDTHLGSGSIAIACHDYGFDLTACELDLEYYEKSLDRLKKHQMQQKLF
jgi:site-specific DNA-methyltransferase (adenine-specific)